MGLWVWGRWFVRWVPDKEIARIGFDEAMRDRREDILFESDLAYRIRSIRFLERLQDEAALKILCESALYNDYRPARLESIRALRSYIDWASIEALSIILEREPDRDDLEVRAMAADSLLHLKGKLGRLPPDLDEAELTDLVRTNLERLLPE